ncbi:unnamed protein product, partial [Clonostachys rhizophaga]
MSSSDGFGAEMDNGPVARRRSSSSCSAEARASCWLPWSSQLMGRWTGSLARSTDSVGSTVLDLLAGVWAPTTDPIRGGSS